MRHAKPKENLKPHWLNLIREFKIGKEAFLLGKSLLVKSYIILLSFQGDNNY